LVISYRRFGTTYRPPSSSVTNFEVSLPLMMEPRGYPEFFVRNYHYSLRNPRRAQISRTSRWKPEITQIQYMLNTIFKNNWNRCHSYVASCKYNYKYINWAQHTKYLGLILDPTSNLTSQQVCKDNQLYFSRINPPSPTLTWF
jgi:hypothetical protein